MSDSNKVVQVTGYKVSVAHHFENSKLELTTPHFSEIDNYYSNTKRKGVPVKQQLSLSTLLERLNTIKDKLSKNNSIAILKGLYKAGTSGGYCYEGAPFLFFDIDVKKGENEHLLDSYTNSKVFDKLESISVLIWRSNSGSGIAGVLYIPQLKEIENIDRVKHLAIGNAVSDYITQKLQVNADFDNAQNKFRQVRYLAKQTESRRFNKNPYVFTYDVKEVAKISEHGVRQYKFADNRAVAGSIQEQFNNNTTIETALLDNGFHKVNSNRYRHPRTKSTTTGVTKENVFFNHSSSFSTYKVFTPYWLYLTENYDYDLKLFLNELTAKGYTSVQPQENELKQAEKSLEGASHNREKQIFEACYNLVNATYVDKVKFADNNAKTPYEKIQFYDYLKIKSLAIEFDRTLPIKKHVSEQLKSILDYTDQNRKTILIAETGTGKTTAFLMGFTKYRPNKRLLLLAPLTAIVEQTKAKFKDVVALTGKSISEEHTKAKTANIVIATYEQGYKHLWDTNTFDYVAIDEVHNLITANSYKSESIKNITSILDSYKIIGLTGTPNPLFYSIGYKLVSVKKEYQQKVDVNFIVDNRNPLKIALQHLLKVKGKCIIRINSRKIANDLKTEVIKLKKYIKSEILILNSDSHIKNGKEFQHLITHSTFNDNIKLVITTSIIDEGLNINQNGFTDAVFIETDYHPMPEAVKQFFARFRNEDISRKNYYYYKETKNQRVRSWNINYEFLEKKKNLTTDAKLFDVNDTSKRGITSTKDFYYEDSSVNDYTLGYDVAMTFYNILTKLEYIKFLELNYNINIIEDQNHSHKDFDITESKEKFNKNTVLVATYWIENNDEVLNALYVITDDLELKKTIPYMGLNPNDEIYDIVSINLKTFEGLYKNTVRLEQLGIDDADSILIDIQKMKPVGIRTVNRKIKLYENIDIINSPRTKTDKINKQKLLNFIIEAKKQKTQSKDSLLKIWVTQRCNSRKPSHYNLVDLVEYYRNVDVSIL